jgi:guanylate kinase
MVCSLSPITRLPHSVMEVEGDIALIVTVAGALTLKRLLPNTMTLFILPASAEIAAARIADGNSPNEIARIASYEAEVTASRHFDSVILNLDFDQALQRLEGVVISRRRSMFVRPKNFVASPHAN